MLKRLHLAALVCAGLLAALPSMAATQAPFTPVALAAAQTAGAPILIAVHAPWCPVCAKQTPILDRLTAAPEHKNLVILMVDFDSQKDALKTLGVQQQSTLIALHGKTEKDRSTGVTDEAAIKALLQKTNG